VSDTIATIADCNRIGTTRCLKSKFGSVKIAGCLSSLHRERVRQMFIAMNRFQIAPGFEAGFETLWRERDSFLSDVPGFVSFALLKGPQADDHTLYTSHTVWESRAAFDAWTQSENFRRAHAQASAPKGTYLGRPNLELFEQVV
jgi:heme-degrading monooxygenase HmoA